MKITLSDQVQLKNMQIKVPNEFRFTNEIVHKEIVNHFDTFNEEIGTDFKYAVEHLVSGTQKLLRSYTDYIVRLETSKIDAQKEIAKKDYQIKSYKEFIGMIKDIDNEVESETGQKKTSEKSSNDLQGQLGGLSRGERQLIKKLSS